MASIITMEQLRSRFDMIAKDCPWKCLYDSGKPCLCRAAAHQIIIDLSPPTEREVARTTELAKQHGWQSR